MYLQKLGTSTEKEPVAIPYINLPTEIAASFSIKAIPAPSTTNPLAISRQFFFPNLS